MEPCPYKKGDRIVVAGNLQPYAEARVVDCFFHKSEARWALTLEWPKSPNGPSYSRVWGSDEGKGWYQYSMVS